MGTRVKPIAGAQAKETALAKISQEDRIRSAKKALADYEAEGQAIRKKTLRLRELRLAKESADRESESAIKTVTKKSKALASS